MRRAENKKKKINHKNNNKKKRNLFYKLIRINKKRIRVDVFE